MHENRKNQAVFGFFACFWPFLTILCPPRSLQASRPSPPSSSHVVHASACVFDPSLKAGLHTRSRPLFGSPRFCVRQPFPSIFAPISPRIEIFSRKTRNGPVLRIKPRPSCFPEIFLFSCQIYCFGARRAAWGPQNPNNGPKQTGNADYLRFFVHFSKNPDFQPVFSSRSPPKGRDASPRRPGCWLSRFGFCS